MIYHKFLTIQTLLLNKVCYCFQHILAMVHTLELSFINKCVPKRVTITLTLFGLLDDI